MSTPTFPESQPTPAIERILADREMFLGFLTARLEDRETAEDILHSSYLKAMEHAGELRDGESAVAWFYRILRNATVDHYRKRSTQAKVHEAFRHEVPEVYEQEWATTVCSCIGGVLDGLKPEYSEAVRQVDLQEVPLETFARERDLTANNASVRLHRARKALAKRLTDVCGSCALHHCLDCTCKSDKV